MAIEDKHGPPMGNLKAIQETSENRLPLEESA